MSLIQASAPKQRYLDLDQDLLLFHFLRRFSNHAVRVSISQEFALTQRGSAISELACNPGVNTYRHSSELVAYDVLEVLGAPTPFLSLRVEIYFSNLVT